MLKGARGTVQYSSSTNYFSQHFLHNILRIFPHEKKEEKKNETASKETVKRHLAGGHVLPPIAHGA